MKFQIKEQAAIVLKKQKKHRIYITAVSMACVLTIFGVVYGLTRPGRAFSSLEKTLDCHVMDEVHQHTAECYDEDGNLICGIADFVAHEHDPETCYDENGELVCTLPEIPVHIHDDSCYLDRLVLVCGIEEEQIVDPDGKPVFDANGEPVYEFENIPEDILMAFNGEDTEAEIVPEEDDAAIEGATDEKDSEEETALEGEAEEADPEGTTDKADSDKADETEATTTEESTTTEEATTTEESTTTEGTTPAEGAATTEEAAPAEEPATTEEVAPAEEPAITKEAAPAEEPAVTEEATPTEEPATTEEAAPAEELITENVEMNQGAAPEDLYKGFTKHVHTSECYKVEKELTCTIPGIHVHTKDCYDEDGNLICGQLQLSVHVHDDDCYIFEEKKVTVTATAGDYLITATYGASAKIPSKAEFRARILEPGTEEYASSEAAMKSELGENAVYEVLFDIGFYLDDEEIEPQGSVDVTVQLNSGSFIAGEEIQLIHVTNDGEVEINDVVLDDENNASLIMDSFSTLGAVRGLPPEGKYGSYHLYYVRGNDAFRNSADFAKYNQFDNGLGIAANFHIIAFDTYDGSGNDVCGNICVNNLIATPGAFGTVGFNNDISYIRNIPSGSALTANAGRDVGESALVIGYGNEISTYDNGNHISVKGKGLDHPLYFFVETSEEERFIDFDALKIEVQNKSDNFAKTKDCNAEIVKATTNQGVEYTYGIKLLSPEAAGYITVDATTIFSNLDSGNYFRVYGFERNNRGTVIINVDMSKIPENGNLTFPNNTLMYYGANAEEEAGTSEVHTDNEEYGNGRVVWNFINCKNKTITVPSRANGIFIAMGAKIVANGNLQGQIIAEDVVTTGETHRTSFKGTTIPAKAEIVFGKTVDGKTPSPDQKFWFTIYEYTGNGNWTPIERAQNNGNNIVFSNLVYDKPEQIKTHWYKVTEDDSDDTSFVYDKTEYLMKVDVAYENNEYKATTTYYELPNGDGDIDFSTLTLRSTAKSVKKEDMVFNNTPNVTKISVTKKWVDYKGAKLEDDIPESLTVYLFRTIKSDNKPDVSSLSSESPEKIGEAVLNAENNWSYSWDNLEIKEKGTKNEYIYYVKEEELTGFVAKYEKDTWFLEGTQEIVNKKPADTTYIDVEKQFFANAFGSTDFAKIDDLATAGIKDTDYVTIKILQTAQTYDQYNQLISTSGPIPYVGKAEVKSNDPERSQEYNFGENDGLIQIYGKDGWKIKIDKLPYAEVDGDNHTIFSYSVEEKSVSDSIKRFAELKVESLNDGKQWIVENYLLPTELEIYKEWLTYKGTEQAMTNPETKITIDLYQNEISDNNLIGTYRLGYDSVEAIGEAKYQAERVLESENVYKHWAAKFVELPSYYVENGTLMPYKYLITETGIDGAEGYVLATEEAPFVYGGNVSLVSKCETSPTEGVYESLILYNYSNSTFTLPETGSGKLIPIYIAGALTMLASGALLVYRRKLRNN